MKRIVLLLALVTGARLMAATADPTIVELVRNANASPEPVAAVFSGLAALPDLSLDGASLDAALEEGGAPRDGLVAKLLGGLESVTVKNHKIEMRRPDPVTVPLPVSGGGAFVFFDKDVSFKTARNGETVAVSDPSGVKVGEAPDSLYDLWNLSVTPSSTGSTLTLTAGKFIFSSTKKFEIPATPPTSTPGILGKLGD